MHAAPSPSARSKVTKNASPRVVVGSDGSHWGQNASIWAAEHAWQTDAELDVWLWGRTDDTPDAIPDNGGMNHVTSTFPLLSMRVHGAGTDPVHDLKAAARHAGLLVIGYRGHSASSFGLDRVVLPLISEVECDTVVVRRRPTSVREANLRITALINGAEDDAHVLSRSVTIAFQHRSRLRVVYTLPAPATKDGPSLRPPVRARPRGAAVREAGLMLAAHSRPAARPAA